MTNLVKRYWEHKKIELADRIEELERELRNERNNRREEGFNQVKELEQQLAAEKALADRLAEDLKHLTQFHTCARYQGTIAAYRKARGL